jgi:hypothetical protein
MKFYPYQKVKSENLKSLLFVARFIAMLGYILMARSILLFVISFFVSAPVTSSVVELSGYSFTNYDGPIENSSDHVFTFILSIITLGIAGFLASMVSIEDTLRKAGE